MFLYKIDYSYDNNNEGTLLVVAENELEAKEKAAINKFNCKMTATKIDIIDNYSIKLINRNIPLNIQEVFAPINGVYSCITIGNCPNCGSEVFRLKNECPECGQDLAWEG